jgi:cobalt-precorrin-5B (C1)-methyltransferase
MSRCPEKEPRACAAAGPPAPAPRPAARAAFAALLSGRFPDPVAIRLRRGGSARFALALAELSMGSARAGIPKDAGDDPDVTHGALVIAAVTRAPPGQGICFAAGDGVGTITRPGLALAVGEPAINPGPREMIRQALVDEAAERCAPRG